MRRLHRKLFKRPTENDILVHKLILEKQSDPDWQLTTPSLKDDGGNFADDFTKTPQWCDPKIYQPASDLLKTMILEDSPHKKAILLD